MKVPRDSQRRRAVYPALNPAFSPEPAPAAPADGSNTLQEVISFLRRHLLLLFLSLLAGGALGFVLYVLQPRTYRALTTLELLGMNETFIGMNSLDPQAGTGTYSANGINLLTQLHIIQSPRLRREVFDKVRQQNIPEPPPVAGIVDKLRRWLGVVPSTRVEFQNEALFMASSKVTASTLPGTRVLVVGCESINGGVAAAYLNELAREYIDQSVQNRTDNTLKTSEWLRDQLALNRTKLDEAVKRRDEFLRQLGGAAGEPDSLENTKLKQLQFDLSSIQADRIAKKSKYDMLSAAAPEAIPDSMQSATLAVYQSKIADLRRERVALLTTLTPQHPKVKLLDLQIAELQKSVNAELHAMLQKAKGEYESSLHREQLTSREFVRGSSVVSSQSERSSRLGILRREVEMLQQSVNMLAQQANQSAVLSAVPMAAVRVLDPAGIPHTPEKPSLVGEARLTVTACLFLGMGLGFALDKFRASRKRARFSTPGMAAAMMRVPELGVIPSAGALVTQRGKNRKSPVLDLSNPVNGNGSWRLGTTVPERAMLADAIQNTLVSILHRSEQGLRRILLSASPGPEEGKTTVACNLAVAMAETGRRVLIVDADLRRPQVHRLFHVEQSPGVSDVLRGGVRYGDLLRRHIKPTPYPGLSVLPSGICDSKDVGPLFLSAPLEEIMGLLREDFDLVVIDTPPLLQFAESRLMGRYSDGVLLVLRSGATEHEAALACQRVLAEDLTPLLGTILNRWSPEPGRTPYYYARQ